MRSSGSTRRRRTLLALGSGWTILSAGCAESGGGPSTETRAAAAQFTIPGYVLTDTIIWENPGARVVLNFEPSSDGPHDLCSDLQQALKGLPGWQEEPLNGTLQSALCGFNGRADGLSLSSGVSRPGRVISVAFWDH